MSVCRFYLSSGGCRYGSACHNIHNVKSGDILKNSSGETCRFFQAGTCTRGRNCAFQHGIQPGPARTNLASKTDLSAWTGIRLRWRVVSEKDNLSSKFRFSVPSPSKDGDCIFYSSDSDMDFDYDDHCRHSRNRLESCTLTIAECSVCTRTFLCANERHLASELICEECKHPQRQHQSLEQTAAEYQTANNTLPDLYKPTSFKSRENNSSVRFAHLKVPGIDVISTDILPIKNRTKSYDKTLLSSTKSFNVDEIVVDNSKKANTKLQLQECNFQGGAARKNKKKKKKRQHKQTDLPFQDFNIKPETSVLGPDVAAACCTEIKVGGKKKKRRRNKKKERVTAETEDGSPGQPQLQPNTAVPNISHQTTIVYNLLFTLRNSVVALCSFALKALFEIIRTFINALKYLLYIPVLMVSLSTASVWIVTWLFVTLSDWAFYKKQSSNLHNSF